MSNEFAMYKGYPLVRKGKDIYYGNMSDEYVCMLNITSAKKVKDLDVSEKVRIRLALTNAKNAADMMVRNSDRDNLFEALDLAYNWLIKTK